MNLGDSVLLFSSTGSPLTLGTKLTSLPLSVDILSIGN